MDPEEDEVEKARRTKIMQFMSPRPGRTHNQNYRILEAIQRARQPRDSNAKPPTPSAPPQEPMAQSSMGSYPPASVEKLRKQNRPGTPKTLLSNGSTHTSANQTPSPTHMYANMPPSDSKRAPTPLQHQYAPSPSSAPPPQPHPPPPVQNNPNPNPNPNPPQTRPSSAVPTFQPPIPNAQFLSQPPAGRNPNGQPKIMHPNNKPPQPNVQQQSVNALYYAQQQQALMMQHRMAAQQQLQQQQAQQGASQQQQQPPQQNGRSTPRPGMNTAQANAVAAMAASRGSPLAPNQRLATRSPAGQNPGPHNHPPASQPLNFSYHTPPHPHLRPNVANGASPRPPQALPPHLAQQRASPSPGPGGGNGNGNGNPAPPVAEGGAQAPHQYQMYYPNVFMQAGGRAPGMPNGVGYPAANGWPMMVPGGRAGANGMQPGGQPHAHHHQVPVGGGGKGTAWTTRSMTRVFVPPSASVSFFFSRPQVHCLFRL
ncbi:hypothetical protein C8R46DRAFT_116090 [Mycena filopes]|nr:hypothetical protein C8R46DRAFT_116090 [Mycena filopes]